jgi:hypothetical protein
MVALTSIITTQQLFSLLKSTVRERERERERAKPYLEARGKERDAYGSYHESCTYTMAHFTIKWKAKERGNYGREQALDVLSHKEKKKRWKKKSNYRLMEKYCISLILVRSHIDILYPIIF